MVITVIMEAAAAHNLGALGAADLIRVAAAVPRAVALFAACFVLPLSFFSLAHSLFGTVLRRGQASVSSSGDDDGDGDASAQWLRLFGYLIIYVVFLYTFLVLSTAAAAVLTAASFYAAKPATVASTLAALPRVLPRLLCTFLWVSLLVLAYNVVVALTVLPLHVFFTPPSSSSSAPSLRLPVSLLVALLGAVFAATNIYISALCHLAGAVTVLEPPLRGLAAMAKSRRLLRGRAGTAAVLVASYYGACVVAAMVFRVAVVADQTGGLGLSFPGRVLVGAVLVCLLAGATLLGLLAQSVFYFACKAFHQQQVDRSALDEHLGGYLGEHMASRLGQTAIGYSDGEV